MRRAPVSSKETGALRGLGAKRSADGAPPREPCGNEGAERTRKERGRGGEKFGRAHGGRHGNARFGGKQMRGRLRADEAEDEAARGPRSDDRHDDAPDEAHDVALRGAEYAELLEGGPAELTEQRDRNFWWSAGHFMDVKQAKQR